MDLLLGGVLCESPTSPPGSSHLPDEVRNAGDVGGLGGEGGGHRGLQLRQGDARLGPLQSLRRGKRRGPPQAGQVSAGKSWLQAAPPSPTPLSLLHFYTLAIFAFASASFSFSPLRFCSFSLRFYFYFYFSFYYFVLLLYVVLNLLQRDAHLTVRRFWAAYSIQNNTTKGMNVYLFVALYKSVKSQ